MEETTIPTNPFPRMDITPLGYGDGAEKAEKAFCR